MIRDVVPCEDGYTQERALLGPILEQIRLKDCIVADRNFCVIAFMAGIAARNGSFVIRHHGNLKCWSPAGKLKFKGSTETGDVFEQEIVVHQEATGTKLKLRRITVKLKTKTRDGTAMISGEIHILTNLKTKDATAVQVSELYRKRWRIEGLFQELTQSLRCEIDTLARREITGASGGVRVLPCGEGVQRGFAGAGGVAKRSRRVCGGGVVVVSFVFGNGDGLGGHGPVNQFSAVETKDWSRLIDGLSVASYAKLLRELAGRMNLVKYKRSRRGPKKTRPPRDDSDGPHVSTARILAERNVKKTKIKKQ